MGRTDPKLSRVTSQIANNKHKTSSLTQLVFDKSRFNSKSPGPGRGLERLTPDNNDCLARCISGTNTTGMRTRVLGFILLLWFIALPLLAIDGRNATVYVYRPAGIEAMLKRPSIYLDGVEIARLNTGKYLKFEVAPGRHLITSAAYVKGNPSLNFESGKKYFFELTVRYFHLSGAPLMDLRETPEPKALKDIKTLKQTDVN